MKWANSASMTVRRNCPGVDSQVPVSIRPSGAEKPSRLDSLTGVPLPGFGGLPAGLIISVLKYAGALI